MAAEPPIQHAIAFVDGQNLFYAAREAFNYDYPNYDIRALAQAVCSAQGWQLKQVRFYTGGPARGDDRRKHLFWSAKLLSMSRQGVETFTREVRYRQEAVRLPDGSTRTIRIGEEKGIDVRIAVDVIRLAHRAEYDVALLFSQDQDLAEVAEELRVIAREQNRWIRVASAFPVSAVSVNKRGINRTDWIRIDRATYDSCIDPYDYRRRSER